MTTQRPIEFRAWDKRRKKIVFDFVVGAKGGIFQSGLSCDYCCYAVEDVTDDFISTEDGNELVWNIMQYTGLLDKNGKKIFEGDIVENDSYIGLAAWVNDEARFSLLSFSDGSGAMIKGVKIYSQIVGEIIGNAYENPELLTNT